MDYLPLFTRIEGRRCLVVGGGSVALRKAGVLRRAGARVVCVAPAIDEELKTLSKESVGAVAERGFRESDLE